MKYFASIKTALCSIAILLSMSLVVSCSHHDMVERAADGDRISFSISNQALFQSNNNTELNRKTRSSHASTHTLAMDHQNSLQIETEVHSNTHNWLLQAAHGSTIHTRAEQPAKSITSFYVTALYDNNTEFFKNLPVSTTATTSSQYWPAAALNFFAYAKSNNNGTLSDVTFSKTDGKYKGTFTSYSLPAPSTAPLADDAEQQPDLIFAIAPNKTSTDGAVALSFHHALSAIKFKLKSTVDDVTFHKVSLKDVYGSGSCTFEATGANNAGMTFVWTPTTTDKKTYVQTVDEALTKDIDFVLPNSKSFMQIPQTISADATIVMDYTVGGTEYTQEALLSEITTQWEANKQYSYTITISGGGADGPPPEPVLVNESNSYIVGTNKAIKIPVSRANKSMLGAQLNTTDAFTAQLVWTDVNAVLGSDSNIRSIEAVGVGKDGYLVVTTGLKEGNAVVAIKKGAKILWSWHIWVTNFTPTPSTKGGFMDRNLGAIGNTPGEVGTKGLYYEWGRKDPFPGSDKIDTDDNIYIYNAAGEALSITLVDVKDINLGAAGNNFANSVANPTTYYYSFASPSDWYTNIISKQNNNLWNDATVKSIYDPCPIGWRVPKFEAWKDINKNGAFLYDFRKKGRTNNEFGGFYPYSGQYGNGNGRLSGVGERAGYWSTTYILSPYNNSDYLNRIMYAYTDTYYLEGNNASRTNGFSVRCVKD